MSVIQDSANHRAVPSISGPITDRARIQSRNVRSDPAELCITLPTWSVRPACSNTIVEPSDRMAGPLPVCPPPGDRPAHVMSVYQ